MKNFLENITIILVILTVIATISIIPVAVIFPAIVGTFFKASLVVAGSAVVSGSIQGL